jgi:SET domain-containing protein
MGIGSLLNHSETPNAEYVLNEQDATLTFTALKPMAEGEQITIDYGRESYAWDPPSTVPSEASAAERAR